MSIRDYPDVSLYIAATSAVRGAKNRQEVLQHVQKHAGIEIKILSGFDILKQYVNQFLDYPDVSLYIAATSAVRGAKNRQEVLQHVQKHAGIEIKILSGFEEADCMLNVLRNMKEWQSLEAGIKQMLLADLGGGSMEVTVVDASHILYQKSLEYGALRLAKLNTKAQQTAEKFVNIL